MKLKKFTFKKVKSTNNTAIKIIKNSNNKMGIVVSEKQIKGKGQYGKKWISLSGNIFTSIFFDISKINLTLKQITKINCILVKKILNIYYKNKIKIKLPNDLLINNKKIVGILQETIKKKDKTFIIIGIGLNLIKSPQIPYYPTTNLSNLINKKVDRNEIILKIKKIYEFYIPKLFKINVKDINKI